MEQRKVFCFALFLAKQKQTKKSVRKNKTSKSVKSKSFKPTLDVEAAEGSRRRQAALRLLGLRRSPLRLSNSGMLCQVEGLANKGAHRPPSPVAPSCPLQTSVAPTSQIPAPSPGSVIWEQKWPFRQKSKCQINLAHHSRHRQTLCHLQKTHVLVPRKKQTVLLQYLAHGPSGWHPLNHRKCNIPFSPRHLLL